MPFYPYDSLAWYQMLRYFPYNMKTPDMIFYMLRGLLVKKGDMPKIIMLRLSL